MGNAVKEKTNVFMNIIYAIADFWKRLGEPDIQQSTVFNNLDDEKEAAAEERHEELTVDQERELKALLRAADEEALRRQGDVMFKDSQAQDKKKTPVQKVDAVKKDVQNTKTKTRLNSIER